MTSNLFVVTAELPADPNFFRAGVFRSYRFVLNTIMILLVYALAAVIWLRVGAYMPPRVKSAVVLCCVALLLLWGRVIKEHHRVRASLGTLPVEPGTPLEAALKSASAMLHLGLLFAIMLTGMLINAVGTVARTFAK